MNEFQDILQTIQAWPSVDQFRLIDELMNRLPQESWTEISPAWKDEIQRRSELIDQGKMKFYSWEEVCDQLEHEE